MSSPRHLPLALLLLASACEDDKFMVDDFGQPFDDTGDSASTWHSTEDTDTRSAEETGSTTDSDTGGGSDSGDDSGTDTAADTASETTDHSLEFHGTNGIVDLGDLSQLNGVSAYTVQAWARFTRLRTNDTVFGKYYSMEDRQVLLQNWDDRGAMAVVVDQGYSYTGPGAVSAGEWAHLVVVYDGSAEASEDRLKLYIDGERPALTSLWGIDVPKNTSSTPTRFTIGASTDVTGPVETEDVIVPFRGQIDEVGLWTTPLSEDEVAELYADPAAGLDADHGAYTSSGTLVGYWRCDEGDGTTLQDETANHLDGDVVGGVAWSDETP